MEKGQKWKVTVPSFDSQFSKLTQLTVFVLTNISECIKKMWYLYTMEYYSAIKKNKIMSFAVTWMKLENLEKNKYHVITVTPGI